MTDTAQAKVLDALKDLIEGYSALSTETVFSDRSPEDAIDAEDVPCIVLSSEAWGFQDSPQQGHVRHTMLVNFDVIETSATAGTINRKAQEKIAHIIAAVGTDPTLDDLIEEFDAIDVAPPMDNGKSIGGSSLQARVTFYTPRWDHFTIVTDPARPR